MRLLTLRARGLDIWNKRSCNLLQFPQLVSSRAGDDPRAPNPSFKTPTMNMTQLSILVDGERADKCLINRNLDAKGPLTFSHFTKNH